MLYMGDVFLGKQTRVVIINISTMFFQQIAPIDKSGDDISLRVGVILRIGIDGRPIVISLSVIQFARIIELIIAYGSGKTIV